MEEKFKIWNVKINNLTEEKLEKCNKDKGYLAKNIIVDGKWNSPPTVLLPKNVEIGQEVYLIYFDENREEYIVSHMLKRLS